MTEGQLTEADVLRAGDNLKRRKATEPSDDYEMETY